MADEEKTDAPAVSFNPGDDSDESLAPRPYLARAASPLGDDDDDDDGVFGFAIKDESGELFTVTLHRAGEGHTFDDNNNAVTLDRKIKSMWQPDPPGPMAPKRSNVVAVPVTQTPGGTRVHVSPSASELALVMPVSGDNKSLVKVLNRGGVFDLWVAVYKDNGGRARKKVFLYAAGNVAVNIRRGGDAQPPRFVSVFTNNIQDKTHDTPSVTIVENLGRALGDLKRILDEATPPSPPPSPPPSTRIPVPVSPPSASSAPVPVPLPSLFPVPVSASAMASPQTPGSRPLTADELHGLHRINQLGARDVPADGLGSGLVPLRPGSDDDTSSDGSHDNDM